MAVELIRHSDSRLDRQQLVRFMNSYQTVAPLTIGELWAWPSMLKLALIENLRRLAEETLEAREARRAADAYVARIDAAGHGRAACRSRRSSTPRSSCSCSSACASTAPGSRPCAPPSTRTSSPQQTTSEDAIRSEHQRQAAAQVSVANVITSLRLCSTLDWSQYFEAVSLVERVLQRDPAGAYGSMDFLSRDRYRQAVEELAERTGEAQLRVALRAVESARQAAESGIQGSAPPTSATTSSARAAADLETDVAYRPRLLRRVRRFVFAHATAVYLGSIGLLTALLLGLGFAYANRHGELALAARLASRCCCCCRPATSRSPSSSACVARLAAAAAAAAPRLPAAASPTTRGPWWSCPRCSTSVARVDELIEHLEVLALGNLDPRIHFAILERLRGRPRARDAATTRRSWRPRARASRR